MPKPTDNCSPTAHISRVYFSSFRKWANLPSYPPDNHHSSDIVYCWRVKQVRVTVDVNHEFI